jgi:hypothetical protein
LSGRYDEAIRALSAAEAQHLAALLESSDGRAALVTLNLWLGALHAAAEDPTTAGRRFALAQRLDAKAQLDESFWPPAYIALFEESRRTPAARASFVVTSKLPHVRFAWNGSSQRIGASFETVEGWHYLLVERLGFESVAERVEVRAGVLEARAVAPVSPRHHVPISAAMSWYRLRPGATIAALAKSTAAERFVVISGKRLALHDRSGQLLASVTGQSASAATSALFSTQGAPTQERSILRRWWFWTAVGVGVAGIVGGTVWATRDKELRGTFVVGGSM